MALSGHLGRKLKCLLLTQRGHWHKQQCEHFMLALTPNLACRGGALGLFSQGLIAEKNSVRSEEKRARFRTRFFRLVD